MSVPDTVEVLIEPGLCELRSLASGTRYVVDTRLGARPRYLRVPGETAPTLRLDVDWHPLAMIECLPRCWNGHRFLEASEINSTDVRQWTLRVGSEHVFYTPDPDRPPIYWVRSSPAGAVTHLDVLPPGVLAAPFSARPWEP